MNHDMCHCAGVNCLLKKKCLRHYLWLDAVKKKLVVSCTTEFFNDCPLFVEVKPNFKKK